MQRAFDLLFGQSYQIWNTQSITPNVAINTACPVWRARDPPCGQCVLRLLQSGKTAREMCAHEEPTVFIAKFEGHRDVMKEFVFRRGGQGYASLSTPSSYRP